MYRLTGVVGERIAEEGERVVVEAAAGTDACPACGQASARVHSRYACALADLPACGRPTLLARGHGNNAITGHLFATLGVADRAAVTRFTVDHGFAWPPMHSRAQHHSTAVLIPGWFPSKIQSRD